MRLTILPVDGTVNKDGVAYIRLDLSDCNIPSDIHALQWSNNAGWIEYKDPVPNLDIIALPDWANNCLSIWEQTHDKVLNPPPPTAEENKALAISKLLKTDWAVMPDVSDPTKSNPYLENVQDFINYRNAVRQIAINPVAGVLTWVDLPEERWKSL